MNLRKIGKKKHKNQPGLKLKSAIMCLLSLGSCGPQTNQATIAIVVTVESRLPPLAWW